MKPHQSNIFAYRLKIARKSKKLSQEKLGILAGIDENSASARMNQYERGKHTPDFLTLSKIAQTLDLPTAYFFAETDDLAELIKSYSLLSEAEQIEITNFIKNLLEN